MNAPWDMTLVALVVAAVAAIAYMVVDGWRRVVNERGELPFFRMAKERGVDLPVAGDAGAMQTAFAVRRCALCSGKDECRQAFAAGRPGDAVPDCPNAEFFAGLKHR